MDQKTAEELYGKILSATKQIRSEIMSDVADSISFGGEMSPEDARELQQAARITGCAFDALIKRGVPVEKVPGRKGLVQMKLNAGDFVCSEKMIADHFEETAPKKKEKKQTSSQAEAPASKPVIQEDLSREEPVEEKPFTVPWNQEETFQEQEETVEEEVKETENEAKVSAEPEFSEKSGVETPVPKTKPGSPWSAYIPEEENAALESGSETEVLPSNEEFPDEHRKHEDLFTFHNYRISVAHTNTMNAEEMTVYIAPLTDFHGEEVISVPVMVAIFYKGLVAYRSTFDMPDGRTMVQISVGDFEFLCRGSFDADGVFASMITTTGRSSDNGDLLTVLSCDRYGNAHNTGTSHLRFRYVVDSDSSEMGVIEVFPMELEEHEFIVLSRTDDYTDYYHVARNTNTRSSTESVSVYEDNVKKELVLNWEGKFLEAELLED